MPENRGLWLCLPSWRGHRAITTITGPIADPAGTVVPNAAVDIRNVKAGAVYQAGCRSRHSPTTATP